MAGADQRDMGGAAAQRLARVSAEGLARSSTVDRALEVGTGGRRTLLGARRSPHLDAPTGQRAPRNPSMEPRRCLLNHHIQHGKPQMSGRTHMPVLNMTM